MIWAAGVQASPLGRTARRRAPGPAATAPVASRCSPTARCPGHPELFVVGDMMSLNGLPGVGGGRDAERAPRRARRSRAGCGGREPKPFHYVDLGTMATIARFRAVVSIGRLQFAGFAGWLLWLVVHLAFLTGFKNRVAAVANWAVAFLGRGRRQRTITKQQVLERHADSSRQTRPGRSQPRSSKRQVHDDGQRTA